MLTLYLLTLVVVLAFLLAFCMRGLDTQEKYLSEEISKLKALLDKKKEQLQRLINAKSKK